MNVAEIILATGFAVFFGSLGIAMAITIVKSMKDKP